MIYQVSLIHPRHCPPPSEVVSRGPPSRNFPNPHLRLCSSLRCAYSLLSPASPLLARSQYVRIVLRRVPFRASSPSFLLSPSSEPRRSCHASRSASRSSTRFNGITYFTFENSADQYQLGIRRRRASGEENREQGKKQRDIVSFQDGLSISLSLSRSRVRFSGDLEIARIGSQHLLGETWVRSGPDRAESTRIEWPRAATAGEQQRGDSQVCAYDAVSKYWRSNLRKESRVAARDRQLASRDLSPTPPALVFAASLHGPSPFSLPFFNVVPFFRVSHHTATFLDSLWMILEGQVDSRDFGRFRKCTRGIGSSPVRIASYSWSKSIFRSVRISLNLVASVLFYFLLLFYILR